MAHVILFVDGEDAVLELLREQLPPGHGWEPVCATTAEEALEILARRSVDVLVTGPRLAGNEGAELVARARELQPGIGAIVATGSVRAIASRLSEERRRLERVVECLADGLLFADAKSEAVIANPAARRMLQAPEGQDLTVRWLKEALHFYPFDLVRGLAAEGGAPALVSEELRIGDRALSSIVSPVRSIITVVPMGVGRFVVSIGCRFPPREPAVGASPPHLDRVTTAVPPA